SERKRAERELERRYAKLLTLYDMADAVSRADGMARIHEAALTGLRNALGIERAAILLFDGAGVMRFAAWRGLSEEYRRAVEGHSPWSRDARDVHPIVVPDVTLDAGLAGLQEVLRAEGIRALAFIPLVDEGRLLGKLMVYLAEPYQLDDDELRLAQTLARHVSLAIARDRAATTLRESEQAQRLLAETSGVLAASLDFGATLAGVARLVVPRLADLCLVDLVGGDGAIRRVATAANDPERELALAALRAHYAPAPDSPEPAARAIRTGAPVLVSGITDEMLAAEARDEVHHALLRRLGLRAVYAVPLAARGHVAGAITFGVVDSGRRYGPAERALADEMARRAALAVDNARLFRQAQEANHAKSRFLTTMSHELRTPLNAIAGYAELLELGIHGPVSEEQRESLRRIRVNQRHLLGLIDDVLSFATLDAGQLLLAVDDVPLGEVLTEAHALIEPQLRAKRLGYDLAASYDGIRVRADRHRLVQVLLNLLSNAAKFTEPGGSVRTEWEVAERLVRIHVRDSGPGIPADKLEAIFQPFYQLNPGLTRRSDGTGLGLPISRELARAMGGDVWAASVPGEGAVFTVTVPLA
ncbi:MAG TPA: GAF domain-containing sensor histidine kinase, partial [Gemmatimonadaceae bacterium]|nr:GAF domain-containing sensor histidine kinase [Gemmatimonadaceae bacterium]